MVVKQVLPKEECIRPLFRMRFAMQQRYQREIPSLLPGAEVRIAPPLQEWDVAGLAAAGRLAGAVIEGQAIAPGAGL